MTRLRVIEFVAPGWRRSPGASACTRATGVRSRPSARARPIEQRERIVRRLRRRAHRDRQPDRVGRRRRRPAPRRPRSSARRSSTSSSTAEVERIEDLRGATLAVDAVDTGFAIVLRRILRDHGLETGDYRLSAEGGIQRALRSLTQGRAAAGLLGPPWSERRSSGACGARHRGAAAARDFPGIGVAVRAARRRPSCGAALERYLGGTRRGRGWAAASPRDEVLDDPRDRRVRRRCAALLDVVPRGRAAVGARASSCCTRSAASSASCPRARRSPLTLLAGQGGRRDSDHRADDADRVPPTSPSRRRSRCASRKPEGLRADPRAARGMQHRAAAGEVQCIVGENGSGKSTLVKLLAGVHVPDSRRDRGSESRAVAALASAARSRSDAGIATVFQEVLVVEARSVLENVWLGVEGLMPRGRRARQAREAGEVLERLLGRPVALDCRWSGCRCRIVRRAASPARWSATRGADPRRGDVGAGRRDA